MSPKVRFYVGMSWVMIAVCAFGWPYSILTTEEPIWILSLSWAALLFTAVGVIVTVDIKKTQEEE